MNNVKALVNRDEEREEKKETASLPVRCDNDEENDLREFVQAGQRVLARVWDNPDDAEYDAL